MVDSIRPMDRPNVVETPSAPRPTPTPVRVPFAKVLASVGVRAGETAMAVLPGGPMMATALRGQGTSISMTPMSLPGSANSFSLSAEGPGAAATAGGMSGAGGGAAGDPQAALASAQSNEMAMLALQEQVSAQQNSFMVMTNVIKSESDTEKSAIANIK